MDRLLDKASPLFLKSIAAVIAVFIVAMTVVAMQLPRTPRYQNDTQPGLPMEPEKNSQVESAEWDYGDKEFVFSSGNFKFRYSSDIWLPLATSSLALPAGIPSLDFAFRLNNNTCIFGYGPLVISSEEYPQTSYGVELDEFGLRLDDRDGEPAHADWRIYKANVPQNFAFSKSSRQPLPRELLMVRYPSALREGSFMLFDEQGGNVSDGCVQEFKPLMRTRERVYEKTALTGESRGFIYLGRQYVGTGTRNEGKDRITSLFFADVRTGEAKEFIRFSSGAPALIAAHENIIWYFNSSGILTRLDPFSKVETTFNNLPPVPPGSYEAYKNLFFLGDRLFYIAPGDTRVLIEYNVRTEETKKLVSGIASRSIAGYDAAAGDLYLFWAFGDAWDVWGATETYNLITGKFTKLGEFTRALPRNEGEKETIHGPWFEFPEQVKAVECLIVENKTIQPCETDTISYWLASDEILYMYE